MTGSTIDSVVEKGSDSDRQSEDSDYETGKVEDIAAPPSYGELSSQFGSLWSFVESYNNNDETAYYPQKARVSILKACASKPARQADLWEVGGA